MPILPRVAGAGVSMAPTAEDAKRSVRARVVEWFGSYLGQALLQAERRQINQVLPDLFGYHIVQLGMRGPDDLLGSSRISHRVVMDIGPVPGNPPQHPVCVPSALPLASNSIDVMVVPHVLEFEPEAFAVLLEAERVLIGEGMLVVLGFHPWSLWGLWRFLFGRPGRVPWCGRFIAPGQVRGWLGDLGFEVVRTRCFYFRPPLAGAGNVHRFAFLDRFGARCWPYFGGAYLILAKKRVITLTPIVPSWRHTLVPNGVPEAGAHG
jgi:SAM-dependent methyltransferase